MAENELQALILSELRDLNKHAQATGERLVALEQGMKSLVGNGRPGKIQEIETDIETVKSDVKKLQQFRYWLLGASSGVGGLTALLFRLVALGK